jgi:hypothetical protein
LFEAYISGAWFLYWTEDALYWVAKPRVHIELINGARRLHSLTGPAVASDAEDLYFVNGVLVPAHVIVAPETITAAEINTERNSEVRRVMLSRFGESRYIAEIGAECVHRDETGELYVVPHDGDEPLTMVKVRNSTLEPDGTVKDYWLRVAPDLKPLGIAGARAQNLTARNAVASTFGLRGSQYAPQVET